MFKFAIRDDDPNYFTSPSELEAAYSDLPGHIPISYAVVPFHGCTQTHAIPRDKWEDTEEYPLGNNPELVSYLKKGIREESIDVMLHGYNHVKYPSGPEFVAGDNLEDRIKKGKKYLEELLETDIDIFVPPNNSFSRAGLDAVKHTGLRTFYYPTPFSRQKSLKVIDITMRDLLFKYQQLECGLLRFLNLANQFWRKKDRSIFMPVQPYVYMVQNEKEFTCVSMTRGDTIAPIKKQMRIANEHNGKFCLAIHYHSFELDSFRNKFYELIEYAQKELNPNFVKTKKIFS